MPHRNTIRAAKLRAEMIQQLGGRCVHCGRTVDLEFDHIQPRAYAARRLSYLQRINRYRQEMSEGKIQLLCKSCNLLKRDNGNVLPAQNGACHEPF
jgi:5-methylcytosine-specific restriction endonuclease McrA